MTVIVRAFCPEDASAATEVLRAALPFMVTTPEAMLWDASHAAPASRYQLFVAERGGEIVARGEAGIAHESSTPGQAFANVYVRPEHRGHGVGALVLRTAEEYVADAGADTVYSWVLDEVANRSFAERRGYRASRSAHFLRLDLAEGSLPSLPALPADVELVPVSSFADDPRPMFALDAECTADEPGDLDASLDDFGEWLDSTWRHPLLDRELSTVALVDGTPAAFTAARTDGRTRYASGMTGTARAFRGRGLAKLAKTDSLHRARAAGYTEAFTGNDSGNGPMLAINKWFGYDICATEVRYVRDLG
ncbi:GNAT family N-acetyltransferase [Streptomyces sp. TRM66268-LWL]|uniref:GNAT family N-acetyltransferase n=1 Tax=Streptomyces polyasparticus TaxID=2767826 RepID=A0ABR7SIM6_9ACTN|nr:GNAT family N-acetyltransferase [Streptomyces polyasparticus]MBC9715355.1 GNAT family N-acetyltransferase [Streptomyces polyasparticus]